MADEKVLIEIELDDGKVIKGFERIRKRGQRTTKDIKSSFEQLEGAALKFGAALGVALSIGRVTKDFVQFERALAGVAKTTDITGQDLEKIGARLQQLSTEIPVTANELLRLAQVAGQFGVRGTENIIKFTETVGKLQFAIEGIEPETAAQSLTRILNVTGQGVQNIDRLSSALVDLGNNFEATEGAILATGNEVIRATAQFGVSAEEGLALGAALQSVGARAEGSGTAVGKAFRAISKAIGTGGQELQKFTKVLGISGDELRDRFDKDALGVFQLLVDRLSTLRGNSVQLSTTLKTLGLDQDRVLKSLVPLIQTNDKLSASLNRSRQAFQENVALNKEFDRVNQTTQAELQRLQNQLIRLSTTIGRILGPALRENIKFVNELAESFNNLLQRTLGSGAAQQIAKVNFELEKQTKEVQRLTIAQIRLREKLAEDPDNTGLQSFLQQNIDLTERATTRIRELIAERNKLTSPDAGGGGPVDPGGGGSIDPPDISAVIETNEALLTNLQDTNSDVQESLILTFDNFTDILDGVFVGFGEAIFKTGELTTKGVKQLNKVFNQELAGGIVKSVQTFTRALASGENAFEALGKSILGILGGLATQVGTFLIATGIAQLNVLSAPGGPVIAAGIGLVALGTLLSTLGDSGFAAGDPGGASGAPTIAGAGIEDEDIGEEEIDERETKVAINVEGTVLDPVSVGNQIADILNDTFNAGGTRVVTT